MRKAFLIVVGAISFCGVGCSSDYGRYRLCPCECTTPQAPDDSQRHDILFCTKENTLPASEQGICNSECAIKVFSENLPQGSECQAGDVEDAHLGPSFGDTCQADMRVEVLGDPPITLLNLE